MKKFYAAMTFLLLCCFGAQVYYFRSPDHPKAGGLWFDGVDVRFAGPIIMSVPPVQNLDGSFINFYETTHYYLTVSARRREDEIGAAQKTDAKGEPEPVVKTRKVSELVLTHDQMVEAVREKYPEIGYGVVADAIYGCSKLCNMKFTWSEPVEPTPITITVNGDEKSAMPGELTYEEVVKLALGESRIHPLPMLTVTYQIGSRGGSLIKGQSVKVVRGLRINAYDTSNA